MPEILLSLGAEVFPLDPAEFLRSGAEVTSMQWWVRWPVGKDGAPGGGGPRDPRSPAYYFSEMYHWPPVCILPGTAPEEVLTSVRQKRQEYPEYELVVSFTTA